jgi:hypothetical protein
MTAVVSGCVCAVRSSRKSENQRLVVLADPGLGKSWLVRTETHRLRKEALTRLATNPNVVVIPVPMRCDQLATAFGQHLAEKAAGYLVAQHLDATDLSRRCSS